MGNLPKLTRLELAVMETLWQRGASSVRDIQETFPKKDRPAYTTVQTMVYRLEAKKVVRRTTKVGKAHLFEPLVSKSAAQHRLIDDFLALFGGRSQPLMSHLIETGRLTLDDVKDAERALKKLAKKKE